MIKPTFFERAVGSWRRVRGAAGPEGAVSKLNIKIALIVLATVLSAAGYAAAKGGGHGGGASVATE